MRFFEILFEDIWSDIATKWSDKENIPLDQVELYINKYKQLKQKNMFTQPEHKDIQHIYKNMDFLEFKQMVDQAEQKANQTKGAIRTKIKNSKNAIVYRDDSDWLIVVPKNKETSQNIGTETKWCTSTRESSNRFEQYTVKEHGTLIYLINKHEEQKLSNNKSKYAIRFEDETGDIIEIENPQQEPYKLPEKRFTEETGFNPRDIVALIRNSKEWKDYINDKTIKDEARIAIRELNYSEFLYLSKNFKHDSSFMKECFYLLFRSYFDFSKEFCQCVDFVLQNGATTNARFEKYDDGNAFHVITNRYVTDLIFLDQIANILIKHGCDINAENNNHETPLYSAFCNYNFQFAEVLIRYGADVNKITSDGDSILYKIVGSDIDDSLDVVEFLIKNGANVNALNKYKESVLTYAVQSTKIRMVELLLKANADPNIPDDLQVSPLIVAVQDESFKIAKLLIEYGANVNHKDNTCDTPLYIACENNDAVMVKLLLENGALLDEKTMDNIDEYNDDVVALLRAKGE